LVGLCESRGCRLVDLSTSDFKAAHELIGEDVKNWLGVENAVKAFRSYGSTAPIEVEKQLKRWKEALTSEKS
jgi:argininosuccinate lyase